MINRDRYIVEKMINIQVKRTLRLPVDKAILRKAAQLTLDSAKAALQTDLGIVIGSDALLHRLNLQYRQVDATTDVLSFASGEIDPDTTDLYLGDVVISLPKAQEQADAEHHPLADELQLLVVHGTLHLLGFDHAENKEKKRMQASQDQILNQLGLKLTSKL